MTFDELGLSRPIVRAVTRAGYTQPTPIQAQAIPHILAGRDLLGCAQTGTGKTAAFALPILSRLSADESAPRRNVRGRTMPPEHRSPRALILCPTRELASQIGESFRVYGHDLTLNLAVIFGGVSQHGQVRALQRGADVVIATPGRLMDLMNQGHVDLSAIEVFGLDEADRMLDMGFIHDIRRISAKVPKRRQTLLFSATMPDEIRALAASILHDPVNVQVNTAASKELLISQSVYHVPKSRKPAMLRHILRGEAAGRTLVFSRTKHGADRIVRDLIKSGIRAAAIHGNKSQNARTRALDEFKSTDPPVLIATDIASRGIDVDGIQYVINFDLPNEPETYIHRIGRTARAGASGVAVSFCDPDERGYLRAIERLTGRKISVRIDDGVAAAVSASASASDSASAADERNSSARSAPRESYGRGSRKRDPRERDPSPRPKTNNSSKNGNAAGKRRSKRRKSVSAGAAAHSVSAPTFRKRARSRR